MSQAPADETNATPSPTTTPSIQIATELPASWAASHVKGGTSTTANDQAAEADFQDAERRRDEARQEQLNSVQARRGTDPEDQSALAGSISEAVTQQKGLMHTYLPTQNPDVPVGYIPVQYCNRFGEVYELGLADLILGTPDDPNEMMLILICPRCVQRKRHVQDCIIQIRQSNRNFEFRPAPGTVVFEGKITRTLGVIEESERFSCPHCDWRARFVKNKVRED